MKYLVLRFFCMTMASLAVFVQFSTETQARITDQPLCNYRCDLAFKRCLGNTPDRSPVCFNEFIECSSECKPEDPPRFFEKLWHR
jgi:hypothetical protein